MDMMHSLDFVVPPNSPTNLVAVDASLSFVRRINLSWADNSEKEAKYNIERATNAAFTTGLTSFIVPGTPTKGNISFTDSSVTNNSKYWYRVFAIGSPVGDTQVYPGSPNGFPTMSANTVSNTISIQLGTPASLPKNPTTLSSTMQAGPQVSLTWRDNANNETGFVVERCAGSGCSNFASIATPPARNNTGNVTYVDGTVTFGNRYTYRIYAENGAGRSAAPTNLLSVTVPAIPAMPVNLTVTVVHFLMNTYRSTLTWGATPNPTNFTIQRATNATFTSGLSNSTANGNSRSLTQLASRRTTYYYRIRANNSVSGSSAWTNALPFPIRTGN